MRVLILQENGRHEANRKFRECWSLKRAFEQLGHQATCWGLGHSNYDEKPNWNDFDLIFGLENYDQSGWVPDLSAVKAFKIWWAIDDHVQGPGYFHRIADKQRVDVLLHSTRKFISSKRDMWFPNCYDDSLIQKLDVPKHHEVGFCGNLIADRDAWLKRMEKFFKVKRDIFIIGDAMVRAINGYKIHWNKNLSCDVNYRNFETIGCGTCLVTNWNDQYRDLGFIDGQNCMIYRDQEEMIAKMKAILQDDTLRSKIELGALELAKRHTYKVRIHSLLTSLSMIPTSSR